LSLEIDGFIHSWPGDDDVKLRVYVTYAVIAAIAPLGR
jgi:hypothetical protein